MVVQKWLLGKAVGFRVNRELKKMDKRRCERAGNTWSWGKCYRYVDGKPVEADLDSNINDSQRKAIAEGISTAVKRMT